MGKRIISQARGKGSLTYRVRRQAYRYRIKYPIGEGGATILSLIHSPGHSAPLARIKIDKEIFYNPAFNGAVVGQTIKVGGNEISSGNILALSDIPVATRIFNIECNPGDGGKILRVAGSCAVVHKRYDHGKIGIITPKKKEIILDQYCRATIGVVAGDGKLLKPFMKAGKKFYKMRARGKLWPRTSAVKMNAVDHPFGSGRGKRIKSKVAKRNAPPGRRVGHLRPRRTGRKR